MRQLRQCPCFRAKLQICPYFLGFTDLSLFFSFKTKLAFALILLSKDNSVNSERNGHSCACRFASNCSM
uniref:Uncharacterized protein n=1 Tax=Arundo donax TaxID=35708 RepID=A0A0A8YQA8_ARUDO